MRPGPEPALAWPSRRRLVAVWATTAVVLGALVSLGRLSADPLDDPDPARQRPGVLDLGGLPEPAPAVMPDLPTPGRRTVLFFEWPERTARLCTALGRHQLPRMATVAVVVSGPDAPCASTVRVVADPTATLAHRYGLAQPRGGGPPVGYAVVDTQGAVRYRTLDPAIADHLDEVATVLRATP